jgi:hypothetical protein
LSPFDELPTKDHTVRPANLPECHAPLTTAFLGSRLTGLHSVSINMSCRITLELVARER